MVDIPQQSPQSSSASTGKGFNLSEKLGGLLGGLGGDDEKNKQLMKVIVISAIVILVMGGLSFMMWGIAIWAMTNSLGDPSNNSARASGFGELTFPTSGNTPEATECLNNWLKNKNSGSPLNGLGTTFVSSGQSFNINPAFVLAIGGNESSFGTDYNANVRGKENHNYQNMKCAAGKRFSPETECDGDWAKYPSWEKSIEEHSEYLRKYYLDQGKNTIDSIGSIYCPLSDRGCDTWAPTVKKFFDDLISKCPAFSSPEFTGATINANLIVIDPGHKSNYNSFSGTANGVNNEGDHNWIIANKVKSDLERKGFQVLLTKNSAAQDPSLPARAAFANQKGAGTYISLHSNASGGPGTISIVYCSGIPNNNSPDYKDASCAANANTKHGNDIGHAILSRLDNNFGLRPKRYWGGELGAITGLRMPGVLIEMFAHDQAGDLQKVNGKADQLAKSISDGITDVVKLNGK